MTLNKGDKVRIKSTGEIGCIINIAGYIPMYRVDTGAQCIWVNDNEVEEAEDEVQDMETEGNYVQ